MNGLDDFQVKLYRAERIVSGIQNQPYMVQAKQAIEVMTLQNKLIEALALRLQALEGGRP